MKAKFRTPELFVDDLHGRYMGQIAYEQLADPYLKQANKTLSKEDIQSLLDGPDNEWYDKATDNLTNISFKTPTGQRFNINFAEGGLWCIPLCYYRTKQANDFFGN